MTRAFHRGYCGGPYGQLHYRAGGEGGRQLILLHQSPLSGLMFEAAIPELIANGFHVVAPDTPGYGLSDPPENPIDIAGYAACLPFVLDHFGFETTCLLGHHTGAVIAGAFAATQPECIEHLILNGVALLSPEERAFFSTMTFSPMDIQADGSHHLAAWNQRLKASPGWTKLDVMHRYTTEMLALPDRYFWAFDAVFAHDLEKDLAAIDVPTTILTNTGEDLYEASKRAHALRPDFGFESLEGGTHDIVDEQPREWAARVTSIMSTP
ncbi:MAG: alpha/beta hydrolase [Pseudomonadota bacterium]